MLKQTQRWALCNDIKRKINKPILWMFIGNMLAGTFSKKKRSFAAGSEGRLFILSSWCCPGSILLTFFLFPNFSSSLSSLVPNSLHCLSQEIRIPVQCWLFRHVYHSVVDELQFSTSRRQSSAPQGHRCGLSINKLNLSRFDWSDCSIDWKRKATRGCCDEGWTQVLVVFADSRGGRSRQRGKRKDLNKRLISPINQLIQESQPDQKVSQRSDLWATLDHRLINWRLEIWSTDWYRWSSISWPTS